VLHWLCSAWIAEDQVWPYTKFKSKFMITQKIPQSFKEAVDSVEEELQSSSNAPTGDVVNNYQFLYFINGVLPTALFIFKETIFAIICCDSINC